MVAEDEGDGGMNDKGGCEVDDEGDVGGMEDKGGGRG